MSFARRFGVNNTLPLWRYVSTSVWPSDSTIERRSAIAIRLFGPMLIPRSRAATRIRAVCTSRRQGRRGHREASSRGPTMARSVTRPRTAGTGGRGRGVRRRRRSAWRAGRSGAARGGATAGDGARSVTRRPSSSSSVHQRTSPTPSAARASRRETAARSRTADADEVVPLASGRRTHPLMGKTCVRTQTQGPRGSASSSPSSSRSSRESVAASSSPSSTPPPGAAQTVRSGKSNRTSAIRSSGSRTSARGCRCGASRDE